MTLPSEMNSSNESSEQGQTASTLRPLSSQVVTSEVGLTAISDTDSEGSAEWALLRIQEVMSAIPRGKIKDDDSRRQSIALALASVWPSLIGNREGGMKPEKLYRIEQVHWSPPELKFVIERHGAANLGSIYAELQNWLVDLERGTADLIHTGKRQICAKEPRLNVKPIATEIADLILKGQEDQRLNWLESGRQVRVQIAEVIPGDFVAKQTREGRRKRFRTRLTQILEEAGWTPVPHRRNVFEKSAAGDN